MDDPAIRAILNPRQSRKAGLRAKEIDAFKACCARRPAPRSERARRDLLQGLRVRIVFFPCCDAMKLVVQCAEDVVDGDSLRVGYLDSPDQTRDDKSDEGRGGIGSRVVDSVSRLARKAHVGSRARKVEVDGRLGASNKQRMDRRSAANPLWTRRRGRQTN